MGDATLEADLIATADAVERGWPITKLAEKKRRDAARERTKRAEKAPTTEG